LWIAGLLVAVAGLSIPVGFLAATGHESFSWNVASIFGTALGTTALAGFTGALAFTTSGDVRATWELAELTRQDQARRDRPVIVVGPGGASLSEGSPTFSLSLINIGLAPAVSIRLVIEFEEPRGTPPSATIQQDVGVLLVDQVTTVTVTFPDVQTQSADPTNNLNVAGWVYDRAGRVSGIVLQQPFHPAASAPLLTPPEGY
jgi:hypothetical protein